MLIINDQHLGVKRQSGTTPESRKALEDFQFEQFEYVVHAEEDVCILGDLFDKSKVSFDVVWKTYKILSKFLTDTAHTLYLVRGNHDASNIKGEMCSLDFLAGFLKEFHDAQFVYITEPYNLTAEVKIIPHLPNQDIFDLEIVKADKEGAHTLLVHCNYDSFFATEQDHSLNMSKEQAEKFGTVIFAHEHTSNQIDLKETIVWILGCQTPTSIADCKHAAELTATTFDLDTGDLERVTVNNVENLYSEINWHNLELEQQVMFARICGVATAEEAGKATQAVSKFRKDNDAFIVTNAIEIEGMTCECDIEEATEEISNMNIVEMLFDELKDWQVTSIKKIQNDEQVDLVEESKC